MPASTEKDPEAIAYARTLENIPWCDDYEKMISGVLYNCWAPELAAGRFRARRLTHAYNSHFPADATPASLTADRDTMLRGILGRAGAAPFVEPPLSVDYGCNVSVGDDFYANFNLVILDCGMVRIGSRVLLGPSVSILAATHETDVRSRRAGVEYARPVTIGDDCWIGAGVTIMPGVTVGKGCTIGAGSVVTRDVPDFSVAVGSPARVVRAVEPVEDVGDSGAAAGERGREEGIPEP